MATEKRPEGTRAELHIIRRESGCDSYRLEVGGALVWATRAYPTVVGRDGAKERMRRFLTATGYEVVMMGVAPPVEDEPFSEQEIQFWQTYEMVLGGRTWSRVEQLLGKATPRPSTLTGWHRLFKAVDKALKVETAA